MTIMLLAAPGLKSSDEEAVQFNHGCGLQKKQYLFIFMCLIQWLMLVGYTCSTITFTRFLVGNCLQIHINLQIATIKFIHRI